MDSTYLTQYLLRFNEIRRFILPVVKTRRHISVQMLVKLRAFLHDTDEVSDKRLVFVCLD